MRKVKVSVWSKWIMVCVLFFCLSVTAVWAAEDKSLYNISADWDESVITALSSGNADKRVWYSFDNKSWMNAMYYNGTEYPIPSGDGMWMLDVSALSASKQAKLYIYGDVSEKVKEITIAPSRKITWKSVYAGIDIPEEGYVGGRVHFPKDNTQEIDIRTYKEARWVNMADYDGAVDYTSVDVSKLEANGGILYYRMSWKADDTTLSRPSLVSSIKIPKAAVAPKIKLNQTTGYITGISTKMEVQILTGTNQSNAKELTAVNSAIFEESKTADGWYVFKGKAMDLAEIATEGTIALQVRVPATAKKPASKDYVLYQNMQAVTKPSYQVGEEIGSANIGMSYINESIMTDKAGVYEYAVIADSFNLQAATVTWKTLTATNTSIATVKPSTGSSLYIRKKAVVSGGEYIRPSDKIRFPLNQRPALQTGKYSNYTLTIATNAVIEYTLDKTNWYEPLDVNETVYSTCSVVSFRHMVTTSKAITLYYRTIASDTEQQLPSVTIKLTLAKLSKFQKFKIDGQDTFPGEMQEVWARIGQYFPSLKKGVNKMLTGDFNTAPSKINLGLVLKDSGSWGLASASSYLGVAQKSKISINGSPTKFNIDELDGVVAHETMHLYMFMATNNGMIYAGGDRFSGWIIEGMAQVAAGAGWDSLGGNIYPGSGNNVNTTSLSAFKSSVSSHLGKGSSLGQYGFGYYTNLFIGFMASDYSMDDLDTLTDEQLVTAMRKGLDRLFEAIIVDGLSFQNAVKKVTTGKQVEFASASDLIKQLKTTQLESFYRFVVRIKEDMGSEGKGGLIADSLSTPVKELLGNGPKDSSVVAIHGTYGVNQDIGGRVGGSMNKDLILYAKSRNSVLYIGTPETITLTD